ncbi:ComEC/Rec2 family competence protein [Candidatus Wolfebacteria bacterium]|nr:ComEC/Rec2 family competence protein [Candidatus Wolfebacteria bacterium]
MRIHDIFFYLASFFLIGVFIASFKISFAIVVLFAFLTATFFLFLYFLKRNTHFIYFSVLSLFIIVGAFYHNLYSAKQIQSVNIPFGEKIIFNGIMVNYPQKERSSQKLTINIQPPYSGKIFAVVKPYPSYDYGDLIQFEGAIKKPESQWYADYSVKDGVFGVLNYPKNDLIDKNKASQIKTKLFKLKSGIIAIFQKTLSPEKAAFLFGITLGERAEFSKELKDKMGASGTTHLVALSGQNITIIAVIAGSFFGYFLRRKFVFWPTLIIIVFFVLMTGAEASVVRAAIMGGIILLAKQIGRIHSIRNAIAAAALIMVLHNPLILRFDLGFQLSFAALMGIIYFSPIIRKVLKMKEEEGFLGWRENFLTTTSAQLAVLPLILINFGNFSLFSLPANILILEMIPLTMIFGFILGALGFFSIYLATILGWFTSLFLNYELAIIDIFSKFPQSNFRIGILGAIVYYLIITSFIIYYNKSFAKNNLQINNFTDRL